MSAATITPWFLAGSAALFAVLFAVPMMVTPLGWARRVGWRVSDDPLTVYFGRCLGSLLLAVAVGVARAARVPAAQPLMLEMIAVGFAAMVWVHVLGWQRRTQPRLETLEIPGFVLLAAAAIWLRLA